MDLLYAGLFLVGAYVARKIFWAAMDGLQRAGNEITSFL